MILIYFLSLTAQVVSYILFVIRFWSLGLIELKVISGKSSFACIYTERFSFFYLRSSLQHGYHFQLFFIHIFPRGVCRSRFVRSFSHVEFQSLVWKNCHPCLVLTEVCKVMNFLILSWPVFYSLYQISIFASWTYRTQIYGGKFVCFHLYLLRFHFYPLPYYRNLMVLFAAHRWR